MNLIANSGIQLLNVPFEIDLSDNFKMYFHEWFDVSESELKLELAHFFSDEDVWVRKSDLTNLGYAIAKDDFAVTENWETIEEDPDAKEITTISIDTDLPEDSGCFQVSINRVKWEKFENTWFPMPFFLSKNGKSEFGPTNWCRFKLIPETGDANCKKYNLLLAFDTHSVYETEAFEDEDLNEAPVFTNTYDKNKEFALCNDEYELIAFCSQASNCGWVDKYVLSKFHEVDDINALRGQKPKLSYLAQYIYLIRYIQQSQTVPAVTLFSNKNVAYGNVDLAVDIGNSRTCVMLFENGDFNQASPLELQNFTSPVKGKNLNKQRDPFDMRLAFRQADFGGKFGIENSRQFVYPSMIRLGKEANQLIHEAVNLNTGAEKTSTFSSPKRFLWDTKPQKKEWEFIQLEGETAKPIYINGISQQLNNDGSLNNQGDGGMLMNYSRRALMTFAFLEILTQANMQINSYEQRNHWGNESMPRQIGRIIVTCPTAMSRVEQISLRQCAEDAAIILKRFYEDTYRGEIDEKEIRGKVQVIPSAKNLAMKEERSEWIYDEATAAQFVFLYAEIADRYQKNIKNYFDLYGKLRDDLGDYTKKSLTIGSVDIGAGTTDIMIAAYKYEGDGQCSLTPVPLFWESFYRAGDDLMKELIRQIVIEGKYSPIEKKLLSLGKNPIDLMQPFLGTDVGVSSRNRQLRSSFNLQISVKIVSYFLELLKEDETESEILSYGDIFDGNPPAQSVLIHFKNHFGFEFDSLQWQYERKVVSAIIEKSFDSLVGKISSLLSYYGCDIVLLSGRPTSLKPLTDLFLMHYAISPNRLKSMNNYRVGRWYPEDKRYPFVDSNGNFINPKSIVATGAMIGNIAQNGSLNGFSLNLSELKEKLLPTTNYFGKLDDNLKYGDTIISPDTNSVSIDVPQLPLKIGARQLDIPSYPSRPFYVLDFDNVKLEDRVMGRLEDEDDKNALHMGVEEEKRKIRSKMPLKITVQRDKNEDIEQLRIEEIIDNEGNNLSKRFFTLQIQSMSELENFWLDSGIFSLNIKN